MEPRSSSEELVYTDDMAEASSDENKSDESMLTEGNDDDTLTRYVVPLTFTSPIARLDSNDSYSSPGTLSLLTSDVQSATETIHHLAQVSTHAHGVPASMESTHVRASPENYETSLVLDQTRSRFDSSSPTRLALPASDFVHETAVYNPALPFGLSPGAHVYPRSNETSPQLMDHVVSARPDESMGVEAITDHVEPSPLLDMVPIHQPIVERHQHLTVFEPDLPLVCLLSTAISANAQAISELHSSVQNQASVTALLQTALHSYEDRVSREVERLSCDVQVLGRLLHEQLPAPPALSDDTRPCLEALRKENQLLHERVSSLVHDKTLLQDRVLLLETRIDQLSLDFSSRLDQASIPAPEPSSGYPFQLPSELTALLTKMSSEMADVKEAIDTSSSNQAFGRAVKYTTIPSSDAHDHCEYFMKQLVEQADRGGLTDDERKSLLGLKLSADKTPTTLNAWWIAYSKTKGGEVWSEIHDSFVDQFCSSTPRDHVDNLIEASERYMDEPVKAYAIRLQTILDEVDFPASKGVAMFKRGVRHARAESCLEHTDRELNSIADCMKLLRAREVRLDETTAKPQ
ncbi:hypothetical protein DYB28_012687, partial [Aphanomyces astaci]